MPKNILLCFAAVLLAVPVWTQEKAQEVSLRWKLKKGDVLRYRQKTETDAKMTMPGRDQEMTLKLVREFTLTVVEADKDGNAELELKLDRVTFERNTKPGEAVKFDSDKQEDRKAAANDEDLQRMLKLFTDPLKIAVERSGKLLSVTGHPKESSKVPAAPDRGAIEDLFVRFPDRPVAAGSGWKVEGRRDVMRMSMKTATEHKLSGVEEYKGRECARIESKRGLEVDVSRNPLFKNMKHEVKQAEASGLIMFALEEGRFVGGESKMDLDIYLTRGEGEQKFEMTEKVHSETTTELLPKE